VRLSANVYHPVVALDVSRLSLVLYPNPVLRAKAQPVEKITDEIQALAARMLEVMHQAPGVGLAAPQVGLRLRLFVANPTGQAGDDRVFVNPRLVQLSREMEDHEEGCLSIPDVTGIIRRPKVVTIEALDLQGQAFVLQSDQLAARVWQHESDHLDGVLIIDRMAPMDRMANQKTLRELERQAR
jgi:peptide deformylase